MSGNKLKIVKKEVPQLQLDNANMNLKVNNCKQNESFDSEISTKEICIINTNETPKENSPLINVSSDSRPFLRITVGNNLTNDDLPSDIQINFLVDSGAACSLLHLGDYEKLKLPQTAVDENNNHQLVAANGTKLDISHKVLLSLTIGEGGGVYYILFTYVKVLNTVLLAGIP